MRKSKLRKDLRLAFIIICIILLGVLATFYFLMYKNPGEEERKVSVFSYEIKDNVSYEVLLKPNSLYDDRSLGEDQLYISSLVDYIDATYSYEYTGEREAEIEGNYEIVAVVEGYTGEGEKQTVIWKKQFPVVEKTSFETKDKNFSITKKVPLRPSDYYAFSNKINQESKISAGAKVTTYLNVELNAKTDKGIITKKSTTSLETPISTNYFKITKNQGETKSEAIQEVRNIPKPTNKNLLIGLGVGIGILLITLFWLFFGTENAEIDPFIKEPKKIFKKYGTRLVALDSEVEAAGVPQSIVHSFEDLVRISDELGKPIVYKYCDKFEESLRFGVNDENRHYVFVLRAVARSRNSLKEKVGAIETKNQANGNCKETQVIT